MIKSLSLGDYEVTWGTKEQLNCYLLKIDSGPGDLAHWIPLASLAYYNS